MSKTRKQTKKRKSACHPGWAAGTDNHPCGKGWNPRQMEKRLNPQGRRNTPKGTAGLPRRRVWTPKT